MAIRPAAPKPITTTTPASVEAALESDVATVERMVDAWLTHKDTTQPQAVPLPRAPALDEAGQSELARRYVAIGWGAAEVKDGTLHLTPAAG